MAQRGSRFGSESNGGQGKLRSLAPQVDKEVTDLHHCINSIHQQLETLQPPSSTKPPLAPMDDSLSLKTRTLAHLGACSTKAASGQICHGHDNHNWSFGAGVVKTLMPPSVTGATPHSFFLHAGFTFPAPTGRVPNLNAGTTTSA